MALLHSAALAHAGFVPAAYWLIPFVTLILAIAVLPLATPHFWERNLNKLIFAVACALPVLAYYSFASPAALAHAAAEYVSFIVLLGSLFVISGGLALQGDIRATPAVNAGFLAIGALLASFIGTTGASMLLIRPLLDTNKERRHVTHTVVFFIFLVSNVGGCLTPLGDPPLFLGYLAGVPFAWTLRLAPAWFVTSAILLLVYLAWDSALYVREAPADLARDMVRVTPLRLVGLPNLALLAGVLVSVAFARAPLREALLIALAACSLAKTPREAREFNRFSFHPILEVAALFAGIFVTMLPALDLLNARAADLGIRAPWQFFWVTGALSSFLDNAPTYRVFLAVAQGLGLRPDVVGVSHEVLEAISLGAVFMGANSYIGNGPNFMVRAIASERGVRMPSFFGYMLISGCVLLPVFALVTFIFFR
jgi:Na+/H+ antiporter NhaD/arsenite permease-like protein